ncbi:formate--tetrahydrofolate ligase [Methylobacterium sp. PvP062]|jgi:formate--tetrahydrofolate ligase|uniref:Formate--tetrahydrofolate ligase n=4 Tax=Methylobacterium TaxID=407 RepID=FTHS_METRJ|nr:MULTISPECIES: formate--tetrahydrofolate ligase [Methylobacterium]B1M0D1.1 RecName: Full=Formate--tetrahydrofolate ligase; AltName: Full=Formyltetrahydrofolate synthetase; Short=FHS; Short=FTHFS [Methylobacterium radiotolerans JCM 2831]MCX7334016.1 formate--tetrahydrofolate ligase [Hyphomicrobiales bacterium]GAN51885.1 formate--tetrahydrofolate ligase [Methylobacterium sp. ME121]ACB26042.1 Formate--tetrahydrofolate ligase [Methylobacterium radiotolerans JCM 2831]KIU30466.1 formate--tetrahydr
MPSDIEIARAATLKPIAQVAEKLGIPDDALHNYGKHIAKIDHGYIAGLESRKPGKLVLVTAISPTPAGEGKTTTTVGLGDALNRIGEKTMICLREPSLGPCFGMKGGAAGGGKAQVVPMEQINLHFTGDFHAITSAHSLAAALIDNHVYWANELNIDVRRIHWRRVVDMNDRALRAITQSLGGVANGFPREDGFDITVASEVMAVFCLAKDLADLEERLGRIVIAETRDRKLVTLKDVKATGAMTVLLKDALQPNLVQTLEGNPALIHGGPFANIAHGCNSVIATRAGLRLADYTVTEAGFGADLGAEKFLDIKCRQAGLTPSAVVVVATIRALKMHGGVDKKNLGAENIDALEKGFANLARHVTNLRGFGLPVVVGVNHFHADTEAEHAKLKELCRERLDVEAITCRHWAEGGAGAEELARAVVKLSQAEPAPIRHAYETESRLTDKIRAIATKLYGAADIQIETKAAGKLATFEKDGYGHLPICMAKTQYSFSTDPTLMGAPEGHIVGVRDVRLSAGAGFVVAICGEIMTMPGLPRVPAADTIRLDANGQIDGLF